MPDTPPKERMTKRVLKDIRSAPGEEKVKVYGQIDELHRAGKPVIIREHKSGFPAVTVECGEIFILTDCLSIELCRKLKKESAG